AQVLRAKLTDDGLTDSTVLYQGFHRRGGTVRVNPANADHLYTTTFGPVALHPLQVSRDGGATWQSFAIESIDGNDYVTGIRDYGPFNHRSPDGSISADGHNKVDGDRDLIGFLPGDPDALVGYFSNMPKPPLRSDDGGLSWVPFATGGTFKPADQIAVSADGQTIALAMSEYGVLVTQDAGLSWRGYHHINAPTMEAAYAAHASQPNPWKSKTGWGVALDPRDPRVMVATYGWGPTHVLRSEDAGESWESVATFEPRLASDPTKPYHDATGVFWHQQNPDIVYAGSLISTDAGRTFTPIPGGKFVTSMANHDGDLLICREFAARIWASSDAGQTWTSIPSPPRRDDKALTVNYNLAAITIDPRPEHNPKHGGGWRLLVGGTGGVYTFEASADDPAAGVWTSPDPEHWRPMLVEAAGSERDADLVRLGFTAADPRPEHLGTIYATPGGYTNQDRRLQPVGLFVSTDFGQTWSLLDEPDRREHVTWWKPTTAPVVVPATGDVLIPDYTGLFIATP
ncbi:MAG: hypothetical protein AAF656_07055, partial [Planctomycetota bacterium]